MSLPTAIRPVVPLKASNNPYSEAYPVRIVRKAIELHPLLAWEIENSWVVHINIEKLEGTSCRDIKNLLFCVHEVDVNKILNKIMQFADKNDDSLWFSSTCDTKTT